MAKNASGLFDNPKKVLVTSNWIDATFKDGLWCPNDFGKRVRINQNVHKCFDAINYDTAPNTNILDSINKWNSIQNISLK